MKRKALVIVNIGTPQEPTTKYVRRYLFQFLNDKRVIDLPWLLRKFLVNVIIVPFRAKKSAIIYKELWTEDGSPLLIIQNNLVKKIQENINPEYTVFSAMRYGNPSLKNILQEIKKQNFDSITILPMFPQYASSTVGSIMELTMQSLKNNEVMPALKIINQFYDNPNFINLFAEQIKSYQPENYDFIIFSYHGLPLRQIDKTHPNFEQQNCNCKATMPKHGKSCYRATCYHSTRLIAEKLNLPKDKFTTSFQSRLSNGWLSPFTDKVLIELAQKGVKKVLVVAPSFVTDCLETVVEIGREYKDLFLANNGEKLTLVESLNDSTEWAKTIIQIVK